MEKLSSSCFSAKFKHRSAKITILCDKCDVHVVSTIGTTILVVVVSEGKAYFTAPKCVLNYEEYLTIMTVMNLNKGDLNNK